MAGIILDKASLMTPEPRQATARKSPLGGGVVGVSGAQNALNLVKNAVIAARKDAFSAGKGVFFVGKGGFDLGKDVFGTGNSFFGPEKGVFDGSKEGFGDGKTAFVAKKGVFGGNKGVSGSGKGVFGGVNNRPKGQILGVLGLKRLFLGQNAPFCRFFNVSALFPPALS